MLYVPFALLIGLGILLFVRRKELRKKLLVWLSIILFSIMALFVGLIGLVWLEGKHRIPEESSFFGFRVTLNGGGSGGYWVYGEDSDNYYTTLGEKAQGVGYQAIAKKDAAEIFDFDPLNYETWRATPIECGDLLKRYDHEIPHLDYVSCVYSDQAQRHVVAKYRVSGVDSFAVEEFLVQKYHTKPLVFTCCYWGLHGGISEPELEAMKPSYGIGFEMFGSAFDDDGGPYKREDVEFTVLVTIWDV